MILAARRISSVSIIQIDIKSIYICKFFLPVGGRGGGGIAGIVFDLLTVDRLNDS
jgi:hypothetical protein